MKSNMMNKRQKSATALVSPETLQQGLAEARSLAEQMLTQEQPGGKNPNLDRLEQVVSFLEGLANKPNLEQLLDDAVDPNTARRAKGAIDMVAKLRRDMASGASQSSTQLPMAVNSADNGSAGFITDRDESGNPKTPEVVEVNRYREGGEDGSHTSAKKKKEAEPVADAAPIAPAPAPAAASAGPLQYVPTEMLLKMVQELPKEEGFAQNKGMQDALVQLTELLKSRPIAPAEPAEGAPAAAAPAPVAAPVASKKKADDDDTTKCENCGKEHSGNEEYCASCLKEMSKKKKADGQIYEAKHVPAASADEFVRDIPQAQGKTLAEDKHAGLKAAEIQGSEGAAKPASEFVADIPQAQGDTLEEDKHAADDASRTDERKDDVPFIGKNATVPKKWESTVKEMKHHKDIDNPFALANWMDNQGYTPHKASHLLRRFGGKFLWDKLAASIAEAYGAEKIAKTAADGTWIWNPETGDVLEDRGRTPEVTQAHNQIDEKPARLERPETVLPIKLSAEMTAKKALDLCESTGKELKALYLKAKPICEINNTRAVRESVEGIYAAYVMFDEAGKVLNKQLIQEQDEEEATKIREEKKKKSSRIGGLRVAAAAAE